VEEGAPIALLPADVTALFAGAATGCAQDDKRIYLAGITLFGEPTDFGQRLCAVGADSIALSYAATSASCPNLGEGIIVHRDTPTNESGTCEGCPFLLTRSLPRLSLVAW
jgi:hypothetical protein